MISNKTKTECCFCLGDLSKFEIFIISQSRQNMFWVSKISLSADNVLLKFHNNKTDHITFLNAQNWPTHWMWVVGQTLLHHIKKNVNHSQTGSSRVIYASFSWCCPEAFGWALRWLLQQPAARAEGFFCTWAMAAGSTGKTMQNQPVLCTPSSQTAE